MKVMARRDASRAVKVMRLSRTLCRTPHRHPESRRRRRISIAKGGEGAGSDVDLLVVTDELAYADIYSALAAAERTLGRTINPTVFTRAEWKKKRTRPDSFAARITAQPRLFVIGSDDGAE
jgi:hypothetical protein